MLYMLHSVSTAVELPRLLHVQAVFHGLRWVALQFAGAIDSTIIRMSIYWLRLEHSEGKATVGRLLYLCIVDMSNNAPLYIIMVRANEVKLGNNNNNAF